MTYNQHKNETRQRSLCVRFLSGWCWDSLIQTVKHLKKLLVAMPVAMLPPLTFAVKKKKKKKNHQKSKSFCNNTGRLNRSTSSRQGTLAPPCKHLLLIPVLWCPSWSCYSCKLPSYNHKATSRFNITISIVGEKFSFPPRWSLYMTTC